MRKGHGEAVTPAQREKESFDQLPPLTSESFISLLNGDKLSLLLFTRTDEGVPLIFPVQYVHRELIYRSPDQQDAVAYGNARLDESQAFKDIRILFSRPLATATLRGLALEGQVKEAQGIA